MGTNQESGSVSEHARVKEIGIPLLSAAIALLGVLSGYVLNASSERSQTALKMFEVTFLEKQKSYAKLMSLLSDSFYNAGWGDDKDYSFKSNVDLEALYFGLEPFLSESVRKESFATLQSFIEFCDRIRMQGPSTDMEISDASTEFTKHRDKMRNLLFSQLFERK